MDNFRWILLAVGILFVVIVYFISRKNKRDFYQQDESLSDDLPDLSTGNLDDVDEGVGEVRVVARSVEDVSIDDDTESPRPDQVEQDNADIGVSAADDYHATADTEPVPEPQAEPKPEHEADTGQVEKTDTAPSETVLMLYILAREGSSLQGKSINSVAHASDMVFGEMNIYHRMDENGRSVFSMINMVKPGSFDPSTIHDLNTPGVSLFLQLPGPENAGDAFRDMLNTAYRMSEALEARLCDRSRQPLTESVVDEYYKIAASFDGES